MAEGPTIVRILRDRVTLVILALIIAAPLILVFWMINQPPGEIASRDDLERVSDSETVLVTRNLDDDALEELPRFTDLAELELNYSDVTDAGMARVGECRRLTRLLIHSDRVTDAGLSKLAALAELDELLVVGLTRVSDNGFAVLQQFPKLRRLVVVRCPGVGDGLGKHVRGLPLEVVDLEQTPDIGDATAIAIAELKTPREINLNFCTNVGDEGVIALAALPAVETLLLHGASRMSDHSLRALAATKTLRRLELPLGGSRITEEGVAGLKEALPECEINR